jgi:hypothetical protein
LEPDVRVIEVLNWRLHQQKLHRKSMSSSDYSMHREVSRDKES